MSTKKGGDKPQDSLWKLFGNLVSWNILNDQIWTETAKSVNDHKKTLSETLLEEPTDEKEKWLSPAELTWEYGIIASYLDTLNNTHRISLLSAFKEFREVDIYGDKWNADSIYRLQRKADDYSIRIPDEPGNRVFYYEWLNIASSYLALLYINKLFTIWAIELILLDDKITQHEVFTLLNRLRDLQKDFSALIVTTPEREEDGKKVMELCDFLISKFSNFIGLETADSSYGNPGNSLLRLTKIAEYDTLCSSYSMEKNSTIWDKITSLLKEIYQKDQAKLDYITNGFHKKTIPSNLSETDYYIFFKYLKDFKYADKPIKAFDFLKPFYEKYSKASKSTSEYFRPALEVNRIYFLNNLISLAWRAVENWDVEGWQSRYKELTNNSLVQEQISDHWTYFTKYKQAYYLLKVIEKSPDSENFEESYKEAKRLLSESNDLYNKAGWSYYPFYSDLETMKNDGGPFSFSTFTMPIKTNYNFTIINLLEDLWSIRQDISSRKTIETLDLQIKNATSEVRQWQTKIVEALAIFSAIVLFVSTSVQLYQYIPTIGSAIFFTLSIWAILAFFVFLIHFIVDGKKSWEVFSICLVFGIAWSIWAFQLRDASLNNDYFVQWIVKRVMNEVAQKKDQKEGLETLEALPEKSKEFILKTVKEGLRLEEKQIVQWSINTQK